MTDHYPQIQTEPGFEASWPGALALATECVLNLHALAERMDAFGRSLVHRHGVPSIAAFNVLTILRGAASPLPPSTIAARMIVTRPTMTGILRTLERRGLVQRTAHGYDGRMSLIEITAKGRSRVESILPELHEAERLWMACLSDEEQRSLLRMVARLQANAP